VGTRCVFRVLRLKPALHAYFFLRAGGAEKPGRSSAQERFYEGTSRTREEGFSREVFPRSRGCNPMERLAAPARKGFYGSALWFPRSPEKPW